MQDYMLLCLFLVLKLIGGRAANILFRFYDYEKTAVFVQSCTTPAIRT